MCPGRTIRLNATAYCGKLFVISFDRSELNHIHALDCMLSFGRNGGATNPVRLCSMGSTKMYGISPSVYFTIWIWLAQRVSHTKMYIVFLLAFFSIVIFSNFRSVLFTGNAEKDGRKTNVTTSLMIRYKDTSLGTFLK